MKEKLYLYKLWNTSKLLFLGVSLLILGQAFFTYKGIMTMPFFPYQMYAFPQKKSESKEILSININGEQFNYTALPNWTEGNIINTVNYYHRYQQGNNWAHHAWMSRFGTPQTPFQKLTYHRLVPSEKQIATYPEWIANYIANATHQPVNAVLITRKKYTYELQRLVPTGEETIILDYTR
ncbi:MAG TPA: hypothetical protein VLZ75_08800 [Chitinophagales bacterium]|nr:hypothetical protein [Chitinophagales bacterium]